MGGSRRLFSNSMQNQPASIWRLALDNGAASFSIPDQWARQERSGSSKALRLALSSSNLLKRASNRPEQEIDMFSRKTFLRAAMAAVLAASAATASAAVDCRIPSQRDATCVGSIGSEGAKPTDNSELSTVRRGANAKGFIEVPRDDNIIAANSCVAVPFVGWAYDPISYGTAAPTFITTAGSGYLGSGGRGNPTESCPSDSDGSCSAWVPATHPYLLTGNSTFTQCAGAQSQGSVSCPVSGGKAYVTTDPQSQYNFSAYMIACKSNQKSTGDRPLVVMGSPISYWQSCTASSKCSFYLVYPPLKN